MILIDTLTTDPYLNLAAEEYFFRKSGQDIALLYINDPSVIVGKHQNPFEEINYRFVTERNIPVIRRISGGGTVYHDHGNLNFTFIVNSESGRQINFERFIKPVTEYLNGFGIGSEVGDKHEVRTGGLKFSGNAAHVFRNRSLHHGTLLFSSRLDDLREALKKGDARFESRSVPSNRTSVINLEEVMPGIGNTNNLKKSLTAFLKNYFPGSDYRKISNSEKEAFRILAEEKYKTREWNYGYGPSYIMHNEIVIDKKESVVSISVDKGVIVECRVAGPAGGLAGGSVAGSVAGSAAGSAGGPAGGPAAESVAGSAAGPAGGPVAGSVAGSAAGPAGGPAGGLAGGSAAGSAAGSIAGETLAEVLTGKFHCWKDVRESIRERGISIEERDIFRLFG